MLVTDGVGGVVSIVNVTVEAEPMLPAASVALADRV